MLDFKSFRLLTFDCYGTLIDWETGIFSALRPILQEHGKVVSDSTLLELYGEFEAKAEAEEYRSYREVLQSVVRDFGERLGFTPSNAQQRSLPDSLQHWPAFPDTQEALQKLQSRYELAVISNIDDDLFAKTLPKLGAQFREVVTAQQAGCYKPCRKLFRMASERCGISSQHWLHVGQSIYHDVVPAKSLGIATVWVNRPSPRQGVGAVRRASGEPDLEVPDLKTLADLACAA
jgi:2-haloacid dehalogenase